MATPLGERLGKADYNSLYALINLGSQIVWLYGLPFYLILLAVLVRCSKFCKVLICGFPLFKHTWLKKALRE